MIQAASRLDGAFTVDVEDYFHVSAFASRIRPADWGQYECRVERSTNCLLELAAETETQGTFFVLGWVAERFPQLIRQIQTAGHEVGCHSFWHQLVYEQGAERFREDLLRSQDTLQQITGEAIRLYRAPSFSITLRSLWALEILSEAGFVVDSSIYPVRHDRYGIPTAPLIPYTIPTPCGDIVEFPGMVCEVAKARIPVGGGGYLRLLPWSITRQLLHSIRRQHRPLNVYVHPWEVDTQQPGITASLKSRFRHYQNLSTTMSKLRSLLTEFRLGTMSQAISNFHPTTSMADVRSV